MTKVEWYEVIKGICEVSEDADAAGAVEFLDHEIEMARTRAKKASERARKRRAEGDALRDLVESKLTEEGQTADDITAAIDDPTISKAKVIARLTQLNKAGRCAKNPGKIEGGVRRMLYSIPVEGTEEEE